jgi:hypothetical protein
MRGIGGVYPGGPIGCKRRSSGANSRLRGHDCVPIEPFRPIERLL